MKKNENHPEPHPLAGKTIKMKDSSTPETEIECRIEDWWDRLTRKSWMEQLGNPACFLYAMRCSHRKIPLDDEVIYGKIGNLGCLFHVSELRRGGNPL